MWSPSKETVNNEQRHGLGQLFLDGRPRGGLARRVDQGEGSNPRIQLGKSVFANRRGTDGFVNAGYLRNVFT